MNVFQYQTAKVNNVKTAITFAPRSWDLVYDRCKLNNKVKFAA